MIMMAGETLYFWHKNEVVTKVWGSTKPIKRDAPCVDTCEPHPRERYGMFLSEGGWEHVPIENFPKEFRLRLLLLGVT